MENPLVCNEIKAVNLKGNQSWIFVGSTDAEAEVPIIWPPDVKNWLLRKDPDAGKAWRQEEKGTTEDEMVGCHHRLDGHEFEQAPGVGDGQIAKSQTWLSDQTELTDAVTNQAFISQSYPVHLIKKWEMREKGQS